MIEQEVKLAFESVEAARQAVKTAGGRLVVSRRLLVDQLLDTADERLRRARLTLRLRREGDRGFLTFKGPVLPGPVKSREEIETPVPEPDVTGRILREIGFAPWFTSEKYREEYTLGAAHVVIDDTPIGVFIEIEGVPDTIERTARALGRTPADYRLESYQTLYRAWCEARGLSPGQMTFH